MNLLPLWSLQHIRVVLSVSISKMHLAYICCLNTNTCSAPPFLHPSLNLLLTTPSISPTSSHRPLSGELMYTWYIFKMFPSHCLSSHPNPCSFPHQLRWLLLFPYPSLNISSSLLPLLFHLLPMGLSMKVQAVRYAFSNLTCLFAVVQYVSPFPSNTNQQEPMFRCTERVLRTLFTYRDWSSTWLLQGRVNVTTVILYLFINNTFWTYPSVSSWNK